MPKEKEELFKKIGVDVSEDNINIDIGKTKDFFITLQDKLQQKAQTTSYLSLVDVFSQG